MRLALIVPSNTGKDTGVLGLSYVAGYLEAKGLAETLIIDADIEDVLQKLDSFHPDVVGITSFTIFQKRAEAVAEQVRSKWQVPLILGGPHITNIPHALSDIFDIGVINEGEATMAELAEIFAREGRFPLSELSKVNGIAYHQDGQTIVTQPGTPVSDLDSIPPPDRSRMHPSYFEPFSRDAIGLYGEKIRRAGMMTSRGCPWRCKFCATVAFWGQKVRFHSAERVVAEMEMLVKDFDIDYIMLWDDIFNIRKERIEKIGSLMEEKGLNRRLRLYCNARISTLDDEMCRLLKRMGIIDLNIGFESGSDRVLDWLKANMQVDQVKAAIVSAKKAGLRVGGSLMFGAPGETIEDMEKTLEFMDFCRQAGVDNLVFFVATPYPGTEFWEIALERGVVTNDMDWDDLDLTDYQRPWFLDESISDSEFRSIIERAEVKRLLLRNMGRRSRWGIIRGAVKKPKLASKVAVQLVKEAFAPSRLKSSEFMS